MQAVLPGRLSSEASARRFQDLLSAEQWRGLPAPVRRRFGGDFASGRTHTFKGHTTNHRSSWLGWVLAQLARLIGAPLPLVNACGPVAVVVTDHTGNEGQVWCRIYHRERGFAQCIQSVKRFRGDTGLEEYLGFGVAMALELTVTQRALEFRSAGYRLYLGRWCLRWPKWLEPGDLLVRHCEQGDGRFTFELSLTHRWVGELLFQRMQFVEEQET